MTIRGTAGDAVRFDPGSGDQAGHLFLIVDGNGVAGYQAGADPVIGPANPASIAGIGAADFIG